jgi:hypothetical protein
MDEGCSRRIDDVGGPSLRSWRTRRSPAGALCLSDVPQQTLAASANGRRTTLSYIGPSTFGGFCTVREVGSGLEEINTTLSSCTQVQSCVSVGGS